MTTEQGLCAERIEQDAASSKAASIQETLKDFEKLQERVKELAAVRAAVDAGMVAETTSVLREL
eukprot:1597162-Rhodomonas_salina.3